MKNEVKIRNKLAIVALLPCGPVKQWRLSHARACRP